MGSYVYGVRTPSVKLRQNLTTGKIDVRLAKYICRYDCTDGFQRQLNTAETNYEKAGMAKYIVLGDDLKDLYGSTVYAYGSTSGVFTDDTTLGSKFQEVGIILGKPRAWYLEDRKDVVEKIHRQREFAKMKAKKLSIGSFGYDYNAYEESLYQKDKQERAKGNPWGMFVRGYCVG